MKKGLAFTFIFGIIVGISGFGGFSSSCFAKSLNQLQKEAAKIKRNSAQTNQLVDKTKEKKASMQQEIGNLDLELVKASTSLIATTNKLEKTKESLANNEKELSEAKEKYMKQYEAYKKRLRYIYENGKISYVRTVFKAHNFHDLLKRGEYMSYIAKHDSNLLKELQESERLIEEKISQIKSEQAEINNLISQEKKRKEELETKVKAKEELMNKLTADIDKYEQQLKDLKKSSDDIENLIKQAKIEEANRKKKSSGFKYSGGKLGWPVPGRTNISSGYGGRKSPISGRSEFHTGLDIPAPTGTKICAAEAGTVIKAGTINGYGYTVIISHGNGLSTLYAHNSRLNVRVGQNVNRGDVVAFAGSTGYSTGPHCHFEVRKDGKHTNPWGYLGR